VPGEIQWLIPCRQIALDRVQPIAARLAKHIPLSICWEIDLGYPVFGEECERDPIDASKGWKSC
jgi:hypothetical protein